MLSEFWLWWSGLGVAVKASVILAFWKSIELIWSAGVGLWERWKARRDRDLLNEYPDLYDRLSPSERWMLRDRADFPRLHLFARLVRKEVEAREMDKMDFDLQIHGWETRKVDDENFPEWMKSRNQSLIGMLDTLKGIGDGMSDLLSGEVRGGDGVASGADPRHVERLAKRAGEVYERAIHMGMRSQQVETSDKYQGVAEAYSKAVYSIIDAVEELAEKSGDISDEVIDSYCSGRVFPLSLLPERVYIRFHSFMVERGLYWEEEEGEISVRKKFRVPSEPIEEIGKELKKAGVL